LCEILAACGYCRWQIHLPRFNATSDSQGIIRMGGNAIAFGYRLRVFFLVETFELDSAGEWRK
jgi:hypothetical protein